MSDPTDPFVQREPNRNQTRRIPRSAAHRRRVTRRHTIGVMVMAAGVVAGGGTAMAIFTTTATTTATLTLDDPSVTVTAGPVAATGLHPGATVPADVVLLYDGPGAFVVTDLVGTSAVQGLCPGGTVRVIPPTPLPTMTSTTAVTVPVGVEMGLDAPEACQSSTFDVSVTVDGRIE